MQNAAAIQNLTRYLVFNAVATYQLHPKILLQMNLTNIGNEKYADRALRPALPARGVAADPDRAGDYVLIAGPCCCRFQTS